MLTTPEEVNSLVEEQWVKQAISGDYEAFEKLIRLYSQALWKFVYRMLGNYEDARDVTQQILLQVYNSISKLETPARFRPWFFTIARNKCVDQLRHRPSLIFSDLKSPNSEVDETVNWPDPGPLPEEVIERAETRRLLQEAINSLPERPRQVVALRYTSDLSFAEIGEVMGINENTVKTLYYRAKTQLRLYLKPRL